MKYLKLTILFALVCLGLVIAARPSWAAASTITTSATTSAIWSGANRYVHYYNGYYWATFHDGTNPVLSTSTNASAWSTPSNMTSNSCPDPQWFATRFATSSLMINYLRTGNANKYYRRTALNSNGTVSWSAASSWNSITGNPVWNESVSLVLNSVSRPWASAAQGATSTFNFVNQGAALTPGGAWTARWPLGANPATNVPNRPIMSFPIADASDVYLIIPEITSTKSGFYAKYWDNSATGYLAWDEFVSSSTQALTYDNLSQQRISAVAGSDGQLNLFYIATTSKIVFMRGTNANPVVWSTISSDVTGLSSHTRLTVSAANDYIYLFYDKGDNKIYYQRYNGSSWSGEATLKYDATTLAGAFSSYGIMGNNEVGVIWEEGSSNPYNIRFDKVPWANVLASATGTPVATLNVGTNQSIGGKFAFTEDYGSSTITGISINQTGTVNAATGLANIRLYYKMDTSQPYDCVSESYVSGDTQYGATTTFDSAQGTSTFTKSIAISTTSALCVFPVLNVLKAAADQSTLKLQITNPSFSVTLSDTKATVTPATLISPGTSTINNPPASPVEFISIIDPGNAYGTDFTTLSDWQGAVHADISSTTGTLVFTYTTGTISGAIANGAYVKGETSNATGTAVHVTGTSTSHQIMITNIVGTFVSGEKIYNVNATSNYVYVANAGNPVIATAKCRTTTGAADTAAVDITGWTTDATHYIKIWTDPTDAYGRHQGKWDTSKYRLEVNDDTGISNEADYIRIDGIQIKVTSTAQYYYGIIPMGATVSDQTDIRISNNIIQGVISGGATNNWGLVMWWGSPGSNTIKIWNNIIYGWVNGSATGGMVFNGVAAYVYNNSVYNAYNGYQSYNNTVLAVNDIAQNTTVGFDNTFNDSSDYNISDHDDTPGSPGSHNKDSTTVLFADATNNDFHLSSSDTAARDAGTSTQWDAYASSTTDIDGTARGYAYDIGADEVPTEYVSTICQNSSAGGGCNKMDYNKLFDWEAAVNSNLTATTTRVFSGYKTGTLNSGDALGLWTSGGTFLNASSTLVATTSAGQILISGVTGTTSPVMIASGTRWRKDGSNFWSIQGTLDALGASPIAVAKIDGSWTATDTSGVLINGWTTDNDNYVKIYTASAARHQGKWDYGKYRIENTNANTIYSNINNLIIDGLQVKSIVNSGYNVYAISFYPTEVKDAALTISNNIILGDLSGSTNHDYGMNFNEDVYQAPMKAFIFNNIIYGFNNGGNDNGGIMTWAIDEYIYNNTFYDSDYGVNSPWGHAVCFNNIAQACTDGFIGSNIDAISDYNISDIAGDAPNVTFSTAAKTVAFVSTTTGAEDFHLLTTDTVAKNQGVDLSSTSTLNFTSDIDGGTRNMDGAGWDIGADEVPAAIYRSVGTTATDLKNAATVTVDATNRTATFSAAQPDNVGVGDALEIGGAGYYQLCFITGRASSTVYYVQSRDAKSCVSTTTAAVSIYRAYNSLANWQAKTRNANIDSSVSNYDMNYDLVASGTQMNAAAYGDGVDTTAVSIDSWSTSEQSYLRIYTPYLSSEVGTSQRADGKWDNTKYNLDVDTNTSAVIRSYIDYLRIDGLQLRLTASANMSDDILLYSEATGTREIQISNNIVTARFSGTESWGYGIESDLTSRSSIVKVWNNIIYDLEYNINPAIGNTNSSNVYAYNNTVLNSAYGYLNGGSGVFVAKNNIAQKCTASCFSGNFDSSSDYNLSSDSSNTGGAHDKTTQTVSFVDPVNKDYHLAPSDTAAIDAGANLADVPMNGLVGYWGLDENPAIHNSAIADSSGYGKNGILSTGDGSTNKSVTGHLGQALSFDGADDWVNLGSGLSTLKNLSQASASAWVKWKTLPGVTSVGLVQFSKNNSGTPTYLSRFDLSTYGGSANTWSCGGRAPDSDSEQLVKTTGAFSADVWYHVVCVVDYANDTAAIYVNGVPQSTTGTVSFANTATDNTTSASAAIGAEDDGAYHVGDGGSGGFASATIDDVRVYNRALTATEIAVLYKNGPIAPFNNDIDNQLRKSWDIGADEASVEFAPTIMQSGGDFSSLASWQAANKVNLVATTTAVFNCSSVNGFWPYNTTVMGTSTKAYASSTVMSTSSSQILLYNIKVGTSTGQYFKIGEKVYRYGYSSSTNYCILSNAGNPAIAAAKIDGAWTVPDTITSQFAIDGFTTGKYNYVRIYTTPTARHQGKWDDTKYRILFSNMWYGDGIDIQNNYVWLDGLQVYNEYCGYLRMVGIDSTGADTDIRISNNIIKDDVTSISGIEVQNGQKAYVWNNILYGFNNDGIAIFDNCWDGGTITYVYNNTVLDSSWGIDGYAASAMEVINNIVQNCTHDFHDEGGRFTSSSNFNISSDGSAPGTNSKASTSVAFVDSANKDYHLASSDTAAKDAGFNFGTSLIGYWKLDEDPAIHNTAISDSSDLGNNGVLTTDDGSANKSVAGYLGQALQLDGTDDHVSVSMALPTTATFSFWATWTGTTDSMPFLAGPYGSGPDVYFSNGKISWNTWNADTNSFCAIPASANDGNFHHYVFVIESGNTAFYYDGDLCGTASYVSPAGDTFTIGGAVGSTNYMWPGKIDEVRIYNSTLTASEAAALHNNSSAYIGIASDALFTADIDGAYRGASWDIGADEVPTEYVSTICENKSAGGDCAHMDNNKLSDWQNNVVSDLTSPTTRVFGGALTGILNFNDTVTLVNPDYATTTVTGSVVATTSDQILIDGIANSTTPLNAATGSELWVSNGNYWTIGGAGDALGASPIAIAKIDGSWTATDTIEVDIDGWATSYDNYIKIYTASAARAAGKWDYNKYRLSGSYNSIAVSEENVRIDSLQIYVSRSADGGEGIIFGSGFTSGDIQISNNLFSANLTGGDYHAGISVENGYYLAKIWNNIFYNFRQGTNPYNGGVWVDDSATTRAYLYNNTAYNCYYGFYGGNGAALAINNIAQNCNDGYESSTYNHNSDFNISNIADDAPNATYSKAAKTVSFVSTSTGDFHLTGSDTAARDQGVDLSSTSTLSFSTDIDGQARNFNNAWDIGADEYRQAVVYRSVGPGNTSALQCGGGSNSMTISSTTAISNFQFPISNTIGVGDAIVYNASSSILFISGRTSSTTYSVQTVDGSSPGDVTNDTGWCIYRAYTSLDNAVGSTNGGTENEGIPVAVKNFDDWTGGRELVANNEVWNVACYGDAVDTTAVTISGWTTGASNYLKIYTPYLSTEVGTSQRHNGKWDENKYRLEVTTSVSNWAALNIAEDYTIIEGLQIAKTGNYGDTNAAIWTQSSTGVVIRQNIVRNLGTGSQVSGILTTGEDMFIYNNLVFDFANYCIWAGQDSGYYAYIYNNTVVNCLDGIGGSNVIRNTAKNNLLVNCSEWALDPGDWRAGSDYNATDLSTLNYTVSGGGNTHDRTSQAIQFVDSANDDFHLAPSDTAAIDQGTSTVSDIVTTDIDGTPIHTYDIGADEASVEFASTIKQTGGDFSSLASWQSANKVDLTATTTAVFNCSATNGAWPYNSSVIGTSSGAYASSTVMSTTTNQVLLYNIKVGTSTGQYFKTGEKVYIMGTALSSNYCLLANAGNPAIATAKIDGTWTVADTNAVDISGWTTGPYNYVRVYTTTTARHQGKWDENKYRLIGYYTFNIYNAYTHIDGIQISAPNGVGIDVDSATAGTTFLSNNIIKGVREDGVGIRDAFDNNTVVYGWNNIIYEVNQGVYSFHWPIFYNNTVYDAEAAYTSNSGYILVKNSIAQNCSNFGYVNDDSDYNVFDGSDAPGSHTKNNTSVSFIDMTNKDFHLALDDTEAKNQGTSTVLDSGSPSGMTIITDIDGQPRYDGFVDIGADEAPAIIYRSVGNDTNNLDVNNRTVSIATGTTAMLATFSGAMPDNFGVGDVIQYGSPLTLAFVTGRASSTVYYVQTETGAAPVSTTTASASVYRAHQYLANWADQESGEVNQSINAGLRSKVLVGKNLVASNTAMFVPCYASSSPDNQTVTISDWTTASSSYIKVYAPYQTSEVGASQRYSGKWDTNKYRIEITENEALVITVNYIRLDGLQIKIIAASNANRGVGFWPTAANANEIRVSNSIFQAVLSGTADSNRGIFVGSNAQFARIWNDIFYNFINADPYGDNSGILIQAGSAVTMYAYNNTFYHNNRGIREDSFSGSYVVINNAAFGNDDDFAGTFTTLDYNASDDLDGTNAVDLSPSRFATEAEAWAAAFTDYLNGDFSLRDNASVLYDSGTTISDVTTDILNVVRPQYNRYDIGAFEFDNSIPKYRFNGTQLKIQGTVKFR